MACRCAILTTGDRSEQKRHFLEVTEITDGWGIEFDPSGKYTLGPERRVEYARRLERSGAGGLRCPGAVSERASTGWSPAQLRMPLTPDRSHSASVNNPSFLGFGLADVQLDLVVSFALWKDKQH